MSHYKIIENKSTMALDTYQHTQWGRQGITLNHPANPLELVQEPFTQHEAYSGVFK